MGEHQKWGVSDHQQGTKSEPGCWALMTEKSGHLGERNCGEYRVEDIRGTIILSSVDIRQ